LKRNAEQTYRRMLMAAPVMFTVYCLIKGFGGKMNYRGQQRGEDSEAPALMQFFINNKYPPDWCFALITLVVDFSLIYLFSLHIFARVCVEPQPNTSSDDQMQTYFEAFKGRLKSCVINPFYPLLVFGQTPMFFYLTHFWVICIGEALFRIPETPSGRFSLFPGVVFVWMCVLLIMYPLCKRYLAFKCASDPESLWRLL